MNTTHVSIRTRGRLWTSSLWAVLVVGSLLAALIWSLALGTPAAAANEQIPTRPVLSPYQLYTSLPSSVVRVEGSGGDTAILQEGENFLNGRSIGAGFFIDEDGHILTSLSVIDGAETIHVTFADGAWYTAETVGTDRLSDLAVLRIPGLDHDFSPLPFISDIGTGAPVFAFGYPEGLTGTLTQGMINNMKVRRTSAEGYALPYLIQSDAVSLPGMAGSPLVNEYGEAVGINRNTLHLSLPIELVRQITPSLIQGTQHPYPLLGVAGYDLSPVEADAMGLDNLYPGAYISTVGADSAAAQGGIQEGDFLTAIDGIRIHTFSDLAHLLLVRYTGGEQVRISVLRGGGGGPILLAAADSLELTITLGTRT